MSPVVTPCSVVLPTMDLRSVGSNFGDSSSFSTRTEALRLNSEHLSLEKAFSACSTMLASEFAGRWAEEWIQTVVSEIRPSTGLNLTPCEGCEREIWG